MRGKWVWAVVLGAGVAFGADGFRVGVHEVDISPKAFPIIVSGGFLAKTAERLESPLYARAVVLDDGARRVVIAVVDSLMMPRELLDEVKEKAARATGIPPERMLIAANHTHSTPPVMGALGTDVNPEYAEMVRQRLVELIAGAARRLEPARLGWTSVEAPEHTHCRRWILRPDKMRKDPFGDLTVRAHMHPGYQNPEFVGPSGPVDPELSLLALESKDGKPLALLANYSMHYVGVPGPLVSPDYFGHFATKMQRLTGASLVMMSQGTSGDLHWMDYSQPKKDMNLEIYSDAMARIAFEAYRKIRYQDWAPIAMAEEKLTLRRRVPDEKRLAWARETFAGVPEGKPRNQVEVYAREQIYLAADPVRELKLQALRLGDLAIAAIPNEVYGITGLKIKGQSPFGKTFSIELANGAEGYIPPPEQHTLGGYTTWPARTAALEAQAEPRITETVLGLLEKLAGKPRRKLEEPRDAFAEAVLRAKPVAYWRLGEIEGNQARDWAGGRHAAYEGGFALYLPGARPGSRAVHLAGGRLRASAPKLGQDYTVELCFWNGLENDARAVTGHLFSRGGQETLGIGGNGRLFFGTLTGNSVIAPKTWNHVATVRKGAKVTVYLNGAPEISGELPAAESQDLFLGGTTDNNANFEGKIDDAAVYPRALSESDVRRHYRAAGL
jgi:hypothetical protein